MLSIQTTPKMKSTKQASNRIQENIMMRLLPTTWTSLHHALAGASAYVVCSTDLLRGAALFLH
jgi:hypothetical protein